LVFTYTHDIKTIIILLIKQVFGIIEYGLLMNHRYVPANHRSACQIPGI